MSKKRKNIEKLMQDYREFFQRIDSTYDKKCITTDEFQNYFDNKIEKVIKKLKEIARDKIFIENYLEDIKIIFAALINDRLFSKPLIRKYFVNNTENTYETRFLILEPSVEIENYFRLMDLFIVILTANEKEFLRIIKESDLLVAKYKNRYDQMSGKKIESEKVEMYKEIINEQAKLMNEYGSRSQRSSLCAATKSWGLNQKPKQYFTIHHSRQIANNISKLQNKSKLPKN